MNPERHPPVVHFATEEFLSALAHTAAETGFSQRLIEKDYFCTLVLYELAPGFKAGLLFKGGTSLSKVHAGFYRLSEDLDFAISVPTDAKRRIRRERIAPIKELFAAIPDRQPSFRITGSFAGHNESKQYLGRLSYVSAVTRNDESIIVEVSLREPVLTEPLRRPARTLLSSPTSAGARIEDPMVIVLSVAETYAEKLRAALSRREPKIRDFYDIGHALKDGMIDLARTDLLRLVAKKLAVAGNDPVDASPYKLEILSRQLETELKAVLRPADYDGFDLPGTYQAIADFAEDLFDQK
jgi:predicted nucleotidyltransferase component of viral defense system